MQQALERASGRAESVIESVRQRPPKRTCSASGEKSLHHKLYDIYAEECEKEPEGAEELRSSVNLLEKLVAREALPRVVVNLYPGEQGYSLMLKGTDEACSETVRMRYEEGELLQYLDAEQLPPVLLDLLEKSEMNLFHRGCVLAEVRDYRQRGPGAPPGYQSRHVLLRPTMQTLAADVQAIAGAHQDWTQDDRLLLESQLILATAEPLCLDPSVTVACTENRLLYDKQKMNTHPMTRSLRRFSMASLARERARPPRPPPPQLSALASWKKSKASQAAPQYDLKICKVGHCVDLWKRRPCELAVPSAVDVEKYAKGRPSGPRAGSRPSARPVAEVKEDSAPGAEAGSAAQTARPTFPRPGKDPLSSAERPHAETRRERQMSLPGDPSADDHSSLDTDAGRVVSRSGELVPKKAPCPVKMSSSPRGSTSLSHFSPGKAAHQPDTTLVQSSVLQKGVTHLPSPMQLLPSSGKSSSGNIFIPEHASSILQSLPSAPASKPPSVPQKSSMEVSEVHKIPPATSFTVNSSEGMTVLSTFRSSQKLVWSPLSASRRIQTLSTAISSQRTPATPVMATSTGQDIINVVGPVLGAQTLASGSHPIQGSTPAGVKPSYQPSGDQTPTSTDKAVEDLAAACGCGDSSSPEGSATMPADSEPVHR
ncbi:transcription factor SPT20 homolog [Talpa occidentalis]|uniref:transcription factor SPT20 homolog n=1 Tax=Talpa occidentalis TaxID=50954 RepID=UPI001890B337|nr:transcription factor SPT20 homolog [Talpa occidentalis]